MNSTEIRSILRSPYNRENWKNLYRNIFQNKVTFFESPHRYNINEEIVESLYQIGYATLDDEYIVALFEVNIKSDVNLLSKKIGLRKVISKYISDDKFNGVLTIFENGSLDYRFTFASKTTKVTESGIVVSETESKRYTYILGGNEPCLTPSQRFEGLLKKNGSINLDDIKEAFSVDKLNKEFFNGYKEHYELFCTYFYSSKYKSLIFNDDEKLIRDYVKKFLGRIVFLYFVQKKGWMGVQINKDWGTGDHQFLSNLFKRFEEKNKFYSKILSSIFFEFLSVDRKDDVVELYEGYKIRIPYLNGGLFEKDSVDELEINFRETDLLSLFTFFDRFNFTIYEDDPNEHTVAVDPEMLGHIFENLLEDNRDKGAFYTPKEIVHYMCQESLIEYLTSWFKNKGYEVSGFSSIDKPNEKMLFSENEGRIGQLVIESQHNSETKIIDRSLIENLLKKKLNDGDKDLIIQYTKEFNTALDSVKICDPAIGSGAFPMGLLQEIFITKQTLWNFEYGNIDNFPSSVVKSNIIQNSIYGVDIEKGAVDIARLRFWLSLIIDEDEPKSLPNLDFKIVVGNSLVSLFEKELIEIDWDIKFKNVDSISKLILDQQNKLYQLEHSQHLYFQSFTNKVSLSKDIKRLKIDILRNQLALTKTYFNENNPTLGGFIPTENDTKKNQSNKLYLDKIDSILEKLDSLKSDPNSELNYFNWKLNFPEIFNNKITDNIGFDILIGNPPYISYYGNTGSTLSQEMKTYLVKNFTSVEKENDRLNSMNLFTEKGINLLKQSGTLSFIVNKTMSVLPSYLNFRKYILKNVIFNYSATDLTPFQAIVDCFIFSIKNEKPPLDYKLKYFNGNIDTYSEKPISIFLKNLKNEFHIPNDVSLLEVIEKAPNFLDEIITINRGVNIGGCFEIFLKSEKINDNYFKYLSGTKCIKPYVWKWSNDDGYMLFDTIEEKKQRSNGKTIALGNRNRYTQPKLIIPESSQIIMSAFVEETIYSAYGLLVATSSFGIDYLKYTCGLLNSKLVTFYSIQREILRKGNKATPHVGVKGLNKLPVYLDKNYIILVSKLVDKILKHKMKGSDSSIEENEVDILVYKIYGLNYNQIIKIDPSFSLDEIDYERYNLG
jgi:hypothetical protein